MKPWVELGRTKTPGGGDMRLKQRDDEYSIVVDGVELMSSRVHGSEEALAEVACEELGGRKKPSVLVGGLGMGFTLRAALELLPSDASVMVAELVPQVAEWNRGPLASLAGEPLEDARVELKLADVGAVLRQSVGKFDAILLDVDNGPAALTSSGNSDLYGEPGVARLHRALRPGGRLAVWSAWAERDFEQRLRRQGFRARTVRVRARGNKGSRHVIFVGDK
ncbi:MAG: hypothetical protein KDC27_12680 [Acidobacteria bacterium]|nr:hypothetical protein [Acidobacteriota bacterium]